ncbi:MAG TPA: hypothetical protein VI911_00830 [Patescibacteria group bacterium]|nr:hypothetical protein [Patescibacteria group bacterium]
MQQAQGKGNSFVLVNSALGMEATHNKVYKEPKNNIRITISNNPLKLAVARVCAEWLSAADRSWTFNGSVDKNSERLRKYISSMFPEFTWQVMPSQCAFDIVSLDAKVAIEIKSVKGNSKKLLSNASIYPEHVKAVDILPRRMKVGVAEDLILDVLVVCVRRTQDDIVYDYAIVDGSFWGFEDSDFTACNEMFANLNSEEFMGDLLALYVERYPESTHFITKLQNGSYGNSFSCNLRKLIQIANPVGRSLDMSGVWM